LNAIPRIGEQRFHLRLSQHSCLNDSITPINTLRNLQCDFNPTSPHMSRKKNSWG